MTRVAVVAVQDEVAAMRRQVEAARDAGADVRLFGIGRMAFGLRLRLRRFDLVHAHGAAAEIVRGFELPYVVSGRAGRDALAGARLVLVDSSPAVAHVLENGARTASVVRAGVDVPAPPTRRRADTLATVADLIPRARHADVLKALWLLRDSHPDIRYVIAGEGPERRRLEQLTAALGLTRRVVFDGSEADVRSATLFVRPSVDETDAGVYAAALAGGVPAIGSRREPAPQDLHALTPAMVLVTPGDPEELARTVAALLDDDRHRNALVRSALAAPVTWAHTGRALVAAYDTALSPQTPSAGSTSSRTMARTRSRA